MVHQQPTTTTVAILGTNSAANSALALLLQGAGFDVRRVEKRAVPGLANGLLEGVDLLLVAPDLSSGVRDVLLSVVKGNPKTAAMPVLTLSTAFKEVLNDQASMVLWPSRLEDLKQAIEAALMPASSGQGLVPPRSLGDALAAQQENARNQAQAERYYSEYVHLPADEDTAHVILREVFNERSNRGWKLLSAVKVPSGDALLLEWDTFGSLDK